MAFGCLFSSQLKNLTGLLYICLYNSHGDNINTAFQLPEEMHENVVSISHIPELLLWPSQNNSQNLDKPSTTHLSESTIQLINLSIKTYVISITYMIYHQKTDNKWYFICIFKMTAMPKCIYLSE